MINGEISDYLFNYKGYTALTIGLGSVGETYVTGESFPNTKMQAAII